MDVPLVGKNGRKLENEEDLGKNVEAGFLFPLISPC